MNGYVLIPCSIGKENTVVWESLRIEGLPQSILELNIRTCYEMEFLQIYTHQAMELMKDF